MCARLCGRFCEQELRVKERVCVCVCERSVCVCVREPSELNRGKTSCLFLVFNSRFKLAGKYSIPTLSIFKFAGGHGIQLQSGNTSNEAT